MRRKGRNYYDRDGRCESKQIEASISIKVKLKVTGNSH